MLLVHICASHAEHRKKKKKTICGAYMYVRTPWPSLLPHTMTKNVFDLVLLSFIKKNGFAQKERTNAHLFSATMTAATRERRRLGKYHAAHTPTPPPPVPGVRAEVYAEHALHALCVVDLPRTPRPVREHPDGAVVRPARELLPRRREGHVHHRRHVVLVDHQGLTVKRRWGWRLRWRRLCWGHGTG